MKRLHIALVYNAYTEGTPELPEDRAGSEDLRTQMRLIARTLRRLGHTVTVLPLALDLFGFQRRMRRLAWHGKCTMIGIEAGIPSMPHGVCAHVGRSSLSR